MSRTRSYYLSADERVTIQNALARRGEDLTDLIDQWSADPTMADSDDLASTREELDVLRGLQANYFPIPGQG